jgi:hypothetical protein
MELRLKAYIDSDWRRKFESIKDFVRSFHRLPPRSSKLGEFIFVHANPEFKEQFIPEVKKWMDEQNLDLRDFATPAKRKEMRGEEKKVREEKKAKERVIREKTLAENRKFKEERLKEKITDDRKQKRMNRIDRINKCFKFLKLYCEGKDAQEIATETGMSLGYTGMAIREARKLLEQGYFTDFAEDLSSDGDISRTLLKCCSGKKITVDDAKLILRKNNELPWLTRDMVKCNLDWLGVEGLVSKTGDWREGWIYQFI